MNHVTVTVWVGYLAICQYKSIYNPAPVNNFSWLLAWIAVGMIVYLPIDNIYIIYDLPEYPVSIWHYLSIFTYKRIVMNTNQWSRFMPYVHPRGGVTLIGAMSRGVTAVKIFDHPKRALTV